MRTTITLDDRLARDLQRRAAELDKSFKDVVNETLLRGLSTPPPSQRYALRTVSLGGAREGVDLTKALALAASLEDEDVARELVRRR
jgi:hypothetical protein